MTCKLTDQIVKSVRDRDAVYTICLNKKKDHHLLFFFFSFRLLELNKRLIIVEEKKSRKESAQKVASPCVDCIWSVIAVDRQRTQK